MYARTFHVIISGYLDYSMMPTSTVELLKVITTSLWVHMIISKLATEATNAGAIKTHIKYVLKHFKSPSLGIWSIENLQHCL